MGLSAFVFTLASWLYKPGPHNVTFTVYFVTFNVIQVMQAVIVSPCLFIYFRWWFKNWSRSITPGEMLTGIASYYLPGKSLRRFVELEFAYLLYLQVFFSGIWALAFALVFNLVLAFLEVSIHCFSLNFLPVLLCVQIFAACAIVFLTFLYPNYPKSATDPRSDRDLRHDLYVKSCALLLRSEPKLKVD